MSPPSMNLKSTWLGTDTRSPGKFQPRSQSVVRTAFRTFLGPNFLRRKCSSRNWPLGRIVWRAGLPARRHPSSKDQRPRPPSTNAFNTKTCFTPTSLLVPVLQLKTSMAEGARPGQGGVAEPLEHLEILDLFQRQWRLNERGVLQTWFMSRSTRYHFHFP